ncbi:MAG: hypothetical protein WCD76_09710 [Pyrinomonadaceae bacterium]
MGLWDTITGWVKKDAKKYLYVPIPANHVAGGAPEGTPLEAGKNYFRLWLTEMYLKKERAWFKSWYPVVHSLIRFQFGSQIVEIPNVAGPMHLKGVTDSNLEHSIQLNYNLTTLMPYNGGVVEIAAGLLAMEGKNYLTSAIKVMGDLSGLLVVPQLSAALAIAQPIATGVQDLLSGGNGEMDLGLHQAFTSAGGGGANDLRGGYIAVILADESKFDRNQFWVSQDRLRYGPSQAESEPLTGVTHMLFRIESRTERDDWMGLATIIQARDEAFKAIADQSDQVAAAINRTILLVRTSPDLTRADRKRIADALNAEFKEAKGLESVEGGHPTFASVVTKRAMSVNVDEALAGSEDPLEELVQLGNQAQARDINDIPQEEGTKYAGDEPDDLDVDAEAVEAFSLEGAGAGSWRVAKSLLTLREKVNARAPRRNKENDGTIGDAKHRTRASDHNPWVTDGRIGVVTAMDITNDPANGCDSNAIAEAIRANRDSRVKYIIWNRRIANSLPMGGAPAWGWRAYHGSNPHDHHVHISVKSDKASYDSVADWVI